MEFVRRDRSCHGLLLFAIIIATVVAVATEMTSLIYVLLAGFQFSPPRISSSAPPEGLIYPSREERSTLGGEEEASFSLTSGRENTRDRSIVDTPGKSKISFIPVFNLYSIEVLQNFGEIFVESFVV